MEATQTAGMVELETFDATDWMTWSGAEADGDRQPLVDANCMVNDWDAVCIVDAKGIAIYATISNEGRMRYWSLEMSMDTAIAFARDLPRRMKWRTLKFFKFQTGKC